MIARQITKFLKEQNMPKTKFGRLVNGDPRLVDDIRNGRQIRKATEDKILAVIGSYDAK